MKKTNLEVVKELLHKNNLTIEEYSVLRECIDVCYEVFRDMETKTENDENFYKKITKVRTKLFNILDFIENVGIYSDYDARTNSTEYNNLIVN